jgi:hypothetical protein
MYYRSSNAFDGGSDSSEASLKLGAMEEFEFFFLLQQGQHHAEMGVVTHPIH